MTTPPQVLITMSLLKSNDKLDHRFYETGAYLLMCFLIPKYDHGNSDSDLATRSERISKSAKMTVSLVISAEEAQWTVVRGGNNTNKVRKRNPITIWLIFGNVLEERAETHVEAKCGWYTQHKALCSSGLAANGKPGCLALTEASMNPTTSWLRDPQIVQQPCRQDCVVKSLWKSLKVNPPFRSRRLRSMKHTDGTSGSMTKGGNTVVVNMHISRASVVCVGLKHLGHWPSLYCSACRCCTLANRRCSSFGDISLSIFASYSQNRKTTVWAMCGLRIGYWIMVQGIFYHSSST